MILDVPIESLTYGGRGLGRVDSFVVFVPYSAPGDTWKVRLTKVKKGFAESKPLELVEASPERTDAPCPLFTTCGGCSWQHLPIDVQRSWKREIVRDALRPLPDAESIRVEPTVASPDTWRYRNKMEFTFQRPQGGALACGFHQPGNWRHILDVESCLLAPEPVENVLRAAVKEGERQGLSAWDPTIHQGTLRQLVCRHSVHEDSVLAMLLTGDQEGVDFPAFAAALFETEPRLKGVVWGLNPGKSDVARADEILDQVGEDSFVEKLEDLEFRISLASFFQTNTRGAERLYQVTRDALELTGKEWLLDAYCGTGTIGIFCARYAERVFGIELVREAVWDARVNAEANGLDNCTFVAGDMALTLPVALNAVERPVNRLVVDPPRGGMDKRSLARLLALRASIMVYVSCNPTTMSRDLQQALEAGYEIESVTPVDMFPHTYHIECVTKLRLKDEW